MISLGLRFHDSMEVPFEERLKNIRGQGFTCVHIALSKVKDIPSSVEALTPGYAMWLKREFQKADLDVAVIGCYKNLANPSKDKLKQIQEEYMANLRFASILGAGVVGTETGMPNEDYHYEPEAAKSDEALKIFIDGLRPVVRYAESVGQIIAIEPVWRHIVSTPERARIVLDQIESPNLQIIFDPVNLISPYEYEKRDETIARTIDILGKDIAMIHLKDCRLDANEVKSMGCGLGDMDYTQIVKFALERKDHIHATLEDTKPHSAEVSRRCIEGYENKILGK